MNAIRTEKLSTIALLKTENKSLISRFRIFFNICNFFTNILQITGNTESSLDHAVLAVGYGIINGKGFWLVKNSWSNYWGNDGYILMAQKDNNCGVMTAATYAVAA